jgi:hypothetical protein
MRRAKTSHAFAQRLETDLRARTKSLALGLIAGMAYPFIDLALACRAPTSEACVWGKAYLPLTLGLSLVMVGGVVAILTYLFLARKRHRKSNHDTE